MSKTPSKRGSAQRGQDRRKRPRSSRGSARSTVATVQSPAQKKGAAHASRKTALQICNHCSKDLKGEDRALFVEEEIGRIFCSEDCITSFFLPEIERMEKEYFRRLADNDLSGQDREKFAHLRWITLQEPDEIWREKTVSGDFRFTLISEFKPTSKSIWCVCVCLFLRGEPSFLYLAFPSKSEALVNQYRRGERVQWEIHPGSRPEPSSQSSHDSEETDPEEVSAQPPAVIDGLADEWTEDETLRAQLMLERRADDIPSEDYARYQGCMNQTLEEPDEVWTMKMGDESSFSLYHFIRQFSDPKQGIWFVVVARETEDEEEIEILDAFPTRDASLVDCYRRGTQEVGVSEAPTNSRLVH